MLILQRVSIGIAGILFYLYSPGGGQQSPAKCYFAQSVIERAMSIRELVKHELAEIQSLKIRTVETDNEILRAASEQYGTLGITSVELVKPQADCRNSYKNVYHFRHCHRILYKYINLMFRHWLISAPFCLLNMPAGFLFFYGKVL